MKAVKCFKSSLVKHTRKRMEENGAGGDLNYGGVSQEVLEERNFCMLPREIS